MLSFASRLLHHVRFTPGSRPRASTPGARLGVLTSAIRRIAGPFVLVLAFAVGFVLPACGDHPDTDDVEASIAVEPTRITFHPDSGPTRVTLVNRGDAPVVVGDFKIIGPDWSAFSLVEPLDPRPLGPRERLHFHVAVDPGAFQGPSAATGSDPEAAPIGPDEYRTGAAQLTAQASRTTITVPLAFDSPSWIWSELVPALIKIHVLALGFVLPLAAVLTWLERKQSAMMQDRVGPNMARIQVGGVTLRLWGLLHIVTDGIKMLFKEDFVPRRAHAWLYTLAPVFALAPALIVFAIVPFGDALCYGRLFDVVSQADVDQCAAGRGGTPLQIAQIDVGLLFYFAIASIATYGTTLAGWASYNKWAVLGALRASAQMISYEVALGLTIVGALLVYGSLEPHAIVKAQLATAWGILLQPLAFVLFFTAAIAETKRAPFDLPEGESEIIGYFIEYSGMRFGLFFLSEFMEIVFVSALVSTLFLGGWALPFGLLQAHGFASPLAAQLFFGGSGIAIAVIGALLWRSTKAVETFGAVVAVSGALLVVVALWSLFTGFGTALPHVVIVGIGALTWGFKVIALCWLQLLIRWTLPRFRYDQLMSLGWKGLLPLSIANIVVTAAVVYALTPVTGTPPAAADTATDGPAPDEIPEVRPPTEAGEPAGDGEAAPDADAKQAGEEPTP